MPSSRTGSSGLTVTVGPRAADLIGQDDKVLQAAVDYVARLGGGTVHVLPGTYRLRNAVYLQSHVRILGSGAESILVQRAIADRASSLSTPTGTIRKSRSPTPRVSASATASACVPAIRIPSGTTVIKRTLVARSGNRFKLDRPLRENVWLMGEATAVDPLSDP